MQQVQLKKVLTSLHFETLYPPDSDLQARVDHQITNG